MLLHIPHHKYKYHHRHISEATTKDYLNKKGRKNIEWKGGERETKLKKRPSRFISTRRERRKPKKKGKKTRINREKDKPFLGKKERKIAKEKKIKKTKKSIHQELF